MQSIDVTTVGGDTAGLAVTCGSQGSGSRVAVLEQRVPKPLMADIPPQLHVSIINTANEKLLTRLGAWRDILSRRARCYHGTEVWDKDSSGCIPSDDQGTGYDHLEHIAESLTIHHTLWDKVQQSSDITLLAPAESQQVARGEDGISLTSEGDSMLTACLVIGANSASSWLRNKVDIPLIFWDYQHRALVAITRMEEPHDAVVRRVLHDEDILALLPFSDSHLCPVVWSLSPEEAQRMQQTDKDEFNRTPNTVFGNRLGLCKVKSERLVFPLTGRYARQFVVHRLALVGDAVCTIYSLTGQEVNLGLMDAAKLIAKLKRSYRQGRGIGQYVYLRRCERSRKHSTALMPTGTQGFRDPFSGVSSVKKPLRDIGLKLADTSPSAKLQLIRQVMGLNDLPEQLR